MSHGHAHVDPPRRRDRTHLRRARDTRRSAMRLLLAVLLPVALATLAGLAVLWPGDVSGDVRSEVVRTGGTELYSGTIDGVRAVACSDAGNPDEAPDAGSPGASDTTPENRCATLTVGLDEGPEKGSLVRVVVDNVVLSTSPQPGQGVRLARTAVPGEPVAYEFADLDRRLPLALLGALFVVVVVAVARLRGLLALLGLGFGAAVLARFVFPALLAGENPVLVGLVGSLAIMFVVLYCTHGFSVRTTTALLGTVFGLVMAAGLGWSATALAHLTGAATDDDYLLGQAAPGMRLTAVVVCGMIVAGLGVLNDVTITQASAVWELAEAGESGRAALYRRAMRIGRDHIASTVYTIAFAWAGASLGTLLLLTVFDRPWLETVQSELIAAELVSTLVGSVALVLSVPVTTATAVALVSRASADRDAGTTATP